MSDRSQALPFDKAPEYLVEIGDDLAGNRLFDPAGFTNNLPGEGLIGGENRSLKWYREAEIVHGRVAQLAVVGQLFPSWAHFPGNPDIGVPADAFAQTNPWTAIETVPEGAIWQIVLVIFGIELVRLKRVIKGDKEPGDLGLGQTGFNPFNFQYSEEEYFEKQEQEIKHGRLAMFGAIGMMLQTKISGVSINEQLSGAFAYPEARMFLEGNGALGDYFPQGL